MKYLQWGNKHNINTATDTTRGEASTIETEEIDENQIETSPRPADDLDMVHAPVEIDTINNDWIREEVENGTGVYILSRWLVANKLGQFS